MKTRAIKKSEIDEKWFVVDAKGIRLGKLATKIASILNAKDDVKTVSYLTPKNKVIVLNTKEVDIHPYKELNKVYYRHSGFPGGLKSMYFDELREYRPNRIVRLAVSGMLPKTKQRDKMLAHLFLYEGEEHKHDAQKPETVKI